MSKNIIGVLLFVAGILIGANLPSLSAEQREGRRGSPPVPTLDQLSQDVAFLQQLAPTNSTIMMDVQWHSTNLWWAGRKRNWPLAQYYFNQTRRHIQQLVRTNPTFKNVVDGTEVEMQGIFNAIDTSSLAMVKEAIEKKDGLAFEKNYRIMVESCYACHKSVGLSYLRPQLPTAQVQSMMNMDLTASWPQ